MKKKILAITCLSAVFAFAGCAIPGAGGGGSSSSSSQTSINDNVYNDSQVTVGGNVTSGAIGVQDTVISGVTDLHIPNDANAQTALNKALALVTAAKGEEVVAVVPNTSAVAFGTKGTYKVTFTAGEANAECNVTLYDAPTAGANNGAAVTLKYSEVYTSLTKGITFTDCFNAAIPVEVLDDGGIKNADGSLNLGTFTVEYMGTDKAGQTQYAKRAVTVVEEKNPTIVAQTYDMADDEFVLNLSAEDFNSFLAISLNGEAVSDKYYHKSNNVITIDGNYIFEKFGREGTVPFRYLSAKGYIDTTLTLKDEKEVAIDDTAIAEFAQSYFATFTPHTIPLMECTNPRQSETPIYKVLKDGAEVAIDEQKVTLNKDGDYTLVVTVRGKEYTYNLNAYYNLGYADGFVMTQDAADTLEKYFDTTKTLLELRVLSFDGTKTYALYKKDSDSFGDFAALNAATKALNKTKVYTLRVRAQSAEGELYTQTVHFTVANGETVAILNTEADLNAGNVAPYIKDKSTLTYTTRPIGGRRGVFTWYRGTYSDKNSALLASAALNSEYFVKGNYFSVDLYTEGGKNNFAFFVDGLTEDLKKEYEFTGSIKDAAIYLWNVPHDVEVVDDNGTPDDTTDDTTKVKPAIFRVYNDKGERVYSYGGNAWYTFEFYLPADMKHQDYRGLAVWSGGDNLPNVYTANWKISTTPFMGDTTQNKEISSTDELEDKVTWEPDVWDQGTLF